MGRLINARHLCHDSSCLVVTFFCLFVIHFYSLFDRINISPFPLPSLSACSNVVNSQIHHFNVHFLASVVNDGK